VHYTNFIKKVENDKLTFTLTSSVSPHCHSLVMVGSKESSVSLVLEYILSKGTSRALYVSMKSK